MSDDAAGLADAALSSLTIDGGVASLPDAAKSALTARLLQLVQQPDPRPPVEALVGLAFFLHTKGHAAAAEAMLDVARAAIPVLRLRGIGLELPSSADAKRAALVGASEDKRPVGARGGGGVKWWDLKR